MTFDDWIECVKITRDPHKLFDTYHLNDGRSIDGNRLTESQRARFKEDVGDTRAE